MHEIEDIMVVTLQNVQFRRKSQQPQWLVADNTRPYAIASASEQTRAKVHVPADLKTAIRATNIFHPPRACREVPAGGLRKAVSSTARGTCLRCLVYQSRDGG